MFLRAVPALLIVIPMCAENLDPLAASSEIQQFARRASALHHLNKGKLQAILSAIFRPESEGGLGVVYDNSYTRTVEEVWRDRKANCLSLTAFYVAACDSIGIRAHFAEALNTNRWRRVGSVVRYERHLVSFVSLPPLEDVVADFLPQLRRRVGVYQVKQLSVERVRALFYANRAVELLEAGDQDAATEQAKVAVRTDPQMSVGWNILGVVMKSKGQTEEAERSFRQALVCDARDSSAIGNMEALLRERGRSEEATRYRELGEDVRKKDPFFHGFLAEEALEKGDYVEAQRRIKMALKILPREPEFFLTQARLHIFMGMPEFAVKDLEEAQRWAVPAERERYDGKLAAIKRQQKEAEGEEKGK